jgi:hypothetical protein
MKNRRKSKRVYLVLSTRVFEHETGKLLGQLANLTSEGTMIIGETQLVVGKVYHLKMKLSKDVFSKDHLDFEARCIWSKPEMIAPQFYKTGLEFVKINPKDMQIMAQIIKEYELHV